MRTTTVVAAYVSLLLFLIAPRAEAGKPDDSKRAEARARYESGSKLYNLREFEKALEEFRAVYLLVGDPSLLFNIAQCERQLRRYEDARKSFKSYLREGKASLQQAEEVQRLIAALDVSIEEASKKQEVNGPAVPPTVPPVKDGSGEPHHTPVNAPAAPILAVAQPSSPSPRRTKPWVWGVLGGSVVVVIGVAVGLGVGLTRQTKYPNPSEGVINGN